MPMVQAIKDYRFAADRRGGDAIGVEECPERIQELLDDGDLVLHAAKTLERVAHALHPEDFGREALDDDAFGGKLEESEVGAGRPAECSAQHRRVEADKHSVAPAGDDLVGQLLVGQRRCVARTLGQPCLEVGDTAPIELAVVVELVGG